MFITIARFFQSGGPMMWVILAIGAGALSIIMERLFFFYRQGSKQADELASKTAAHITGNEISEAMQELETDDGPSRAAQMADLDVTPVMNMFIILIPFLISMSMNSNSRLCTKLTPLWMIWRTRRSLAQSSTCLLPEKARYPGTPTGLIT